MYDNIRYKQIFFSRVSASDFAISYLSCMYGCSKYMQFLFVQVSK